MKKKSILILLLLLTAPLISMDGRPVRDWRDLNIKAIALEAALKTDNQLAEEIASLKSSLVDGCSCTEWDCTYQGGSNSGCRRTCAYEQFWYYWHEYKACFYCPDPESLCPPSLEIQVTEYLARLQRAVALFEFEGNR